MKVVSFLMVIVLVAVVLGGLYATSRAGWSEWTGSRPTSVAKIALVLGGLGAIGALAAAFRWTDRAKGF